MQIHSKTALAVILTAVCLLDGVHLPVGRQRAEATTEVKTEAASPVAKKTPEKPSNSPAKRLYSVHGITPPVEWQNALYRELERAGIAWYMPYAVCQVFQESRWNQYADNGKDKGICQQKAVYWYSRAARYGVAGADIWDVYAQFRVFAGMMAEYLRVAKGDVGWALSYYFYGNGQRADKYVADVMNHWSTLKEVK